MLVLIAPAFLAGHCLLAGIVSKGELVPVDVLDSLVGLSLSLQNVEERILRTCKLKLTEVDTDRVQLYFGESTNDLIVEKGTTVGVLKEALALVRAKGYDRISKSQC